MTAHRLLVLTYHWPPFTGAGAARWSAMSRHLRALGHEVTVVTTSLWEPPNESDADRIIRTRDLAASGALRRALRRPAAVEPQADAPASSGRSALRSRLLVPDPFVVSWLPFAMSAARRAIEEHGIDCMITSSPPDSVHLAGLRLGRSCPAWIADFRDGWTFEPLRTPFPTGPQRRLDARLERSVALGADGLVAATGPIGADLERRFDRSVATIRNGWDPALEAGIEQANAPSLKSDVVNLVYTGSLGGVRGHDDRGLLEALRRIVRARDELATRLRVVIAGPLTAQERATFAAPDLSPMVRTLGELPRPQALRLQREADALLLITSSDSSIATGKLYEYLAAGVPILALAGDNEAAAIVRETGTGEVVAPEDAGEIARALETVAAGGLREGYRPHGLERYRYPAPAQALADLIDSVLSA